MLEKLTYGRLSKALGLHDQEHVPGSGSTSIPGLRYTQTLLKGIAIFKVFTAVLLKFKLSGMLSCLMINHYRRFGMSTDTYLYYWRFLGFPAVNGAVIDDDVSMPLVSLIFCWMSTRFT